jgi:hypothetical protein
MFNVHTFPEIPRSALDIIAMQNNEAESLTGIKAFTSGITGNSLGDSVGAIRSASDATAKRELNILRNISNGFKCIGKKIVMMNMEWLSDEEIIRVTEDEFLTIHREELKGDYDIKIEISTPEADNAKAQNLSFILQTTAQQLDPELNKMILSDLARLYKLPDLATKIETYEPQPDPINEEKMRLEIEMMKAEAAKDAALAERYKAEAQVEMAKIASEQAKAAKLQSETDLNDLSFLELETGTVHSRDIDKIEKQKKAKDDSK